MTHTLYVKLSKNSKNYGEPKITYHLADAAEQRPQHPGFQESEQETAPATSDFWNPNLTAHMMVLDFRNPDKKG